MLVQDTVAAALGNAVQETRAISLPAQIAAKLKIKREVLSRPWGDIGRFTANPLNA